MRQSPRAIDQPLTGCFVHQRIQDVVSLEHPGVRPGLSAKASRRLQLGMWRRTPQLRIQRSGLDKRFSFLFLVRFRRTRSSPLQITEHHSRLKESARARAVLADSPPSAAVGHGSHVLLSRLSRVQRMTPSSRSRVATAPANTAAAFSIGFSGPTSKCARVVAR